MKTIARARLKQKRRTQKKWESYIEFKRRDRKNPSPFLSQAEVDELLCNRWPRTRKGNYQRQWAARKVQSIVRRKPDPNAQWTAGVLFPCPPENGLSAEQTLLGQWLLVKQPSGIDQDYAEVLIIGTPQHTTQRWFDKQTIDGLLPWQIIQRDGLAGLQRIANLMDETFGDRPTRIYGRHSIKHHRKSR
jgi:hypothetical protein